MNLSHIQNQHSHLIEKYTELRNSLTLQSTILNIYNNKNNIQSTLAVLIDQNKSQIQQICQQFDKYRSKCSSKLLEIQQKLILEGELEYRLSVYQERIWERAQIVYDKQYDIVYDHVGKVLAEAPFWPHLQRFDGVERQYAWVLQNFRQICVQRKVLRYFEERFEMDNRESDIGKGAEGTHEAQLENTPTYKSQTIFSTQQSGSSKSSENQQEQNAKHTKNKNKEEPKLINNLNDIKTCQQQTILAIYKLLEAENQKQIKFTQQYQKLCKKLGQLNEEVTVLADRYHFQRLKDSSI